MTSMDHPSFPKPTITESLCEIHFVLPENKPWKTSLVGEFYRIIQNEYPEMEPFQEPGIKIDLTHRRILPPQQRVRFRHIDQNRMLQLSQEVLTINILPPYPGWREMQQIVLDTWKKTKEVLPISAISRFGLRYINRIPYSSAEEKPSDWLKSNEYIPSSIMLSLPGFFSRVELHTSEADRLIVTVAHDASEEAGDNGSILFDIDRISQKPVDLSDEVLLREIDRLHTDIWQVFFSAQTHKYTDLLEGKS